MPSRRPGAGRQRHHPPSLVAVALSRIARLAPATAAAARSSDALLAMGLRRPVDAHFRDNSPVDRYVETLATTPRHLDRAAHAVLGSGVKRVVGERWLPQAKRLLLFTVRTVEDIACQIGFDQPASFSRFFREWTGEAPAAWRRKQLPQGGGEPRALSRLTDRPDRIP
ncbi:helix-turn-helix transcriptional regulator [Mesorhizobium intechi]|uniref:helix-turn-helix transcriptional regulator n=1 Tax=Mesorhizobium intechi TaxID=537601 RepID=UPI001FE8E105|nr:helix-turn-helix transcriptional regulator [Mesorhizobium intechi]